MDVFVDYYNLPTSDRAKGPRYVVDRVISALDWSQLDDVKRLHFRLYGGWYEEQALTRDAQKLSAQLSADFPAVHYVSSPSRRPVRMTAEMGYSLLCDPMRHLWHTLRDSAVPRSVRPRDPAELGCTRVNGCPLYPVFAAFSRPKCSEAGCSVRPNQLLRRRRQKLVDGMLLADVVFSARLSPARLTVVSSDDDAWPVMRMAISLGTDVIHVHTLDGHSIERRYAQGLGRRYLPLRIQ